MADPFEEFGGSELPASDPSDPFAEFGGHDTGLDVLEEAHPDVGFFDRARIKLRGDAGAERRLLEERGFEVADQEGGYAIRKPGEAQYRRLEDPGFEFSDITDLAGPALSAVGTIGGGVLGGIPGAALGGAGASGLRQVLSGLPAETPGAALGELGGEAIEGALMQVGGQALGGAARGLRGLSRAAQSAGPISRGGYPAASQALGKRLGRTGEVLEAPQNMIAGFLGGGLGKLMRSRGAGVAGFAFGGPAGTAVGVAGTLGLGGKVLGKISHSLMKDTSGRPLLFLANRASGAVLKKIEAALQLAGQPGMEMAYKASIYQLLQNPAFRRLLRQENGPEG